MADSADARADLERRLAASERRAQRAETWLGIALFLLGCAPLAGTMAWATALPQDVRGWFVYPLVGLLAIWSIAGMGYSLVLAKRLSRIE